jgi:hypothetical protein
MDTSRPLLLANINKPFTHLRLEPVRYHNGTNMPQAKRIQRIDTGKRDYPVTYAPRLKDPKQVKTKVSGKLKLELQRRADGWGTSEGNYLRMLIETFVGMGLDISPKSINE